MRTTESRRDRRPLWAALLSVGVLFVTPAVGYLLWLVLVLGRGGDSRTVGQELARGFEQMQSWGHLVALACALAQLGGLVFLLVRAWRPRLPGAVLLALGSLPWLMGSLGTLSGTQEVWSAVAYVNPADKGTLLAMGFHEALTASLFGGGLSVVQLTCSALALGAAALLHSRAPADAGPDSRPALPGSAALACLAVALAVFSRLPLAMVHREALGALASVNLNDRPLLLAEAAQALSTARWVGAGALAAAVALALGAAWLARRVELSPARALMAAVLLSPAFTLQGTAREQQLELAGLWNEQPWPADFQPMTLAGSPLARPQRRPGFLATRSHLQEPRVPGPGVPLDEAEELLRQRRPGPSAAPGDGALSLEPQLMLALDARLEAPRVLALADAARAAGFRSLRLVGLSAASPLDAMPEPDALLAPFSRASQGAPPLALRSAFPGGQPHPSDVEWHLHLEARGPFVLEPRPDSGRPPLTLHGEEPPRHTDLPLELLEREESRTVHVVGLSLGEGVSAERLGRALEVLARHEPQVLLPVLLPEPPAAAPSPVASDE